MRCSIRLSVCFHFAVVTTCLLFNKSVSNPCVAAPPDAGGAAQSENTFRGTGVAAQDSPVPRTDSFETKMRLLQSAWECGDYDLARSLTHSLRDTVIQTQNEEQDPGESLLPAAQFSLVSSLPPKAAHWADGWKFFKTINVTETSGEPRRAEPVEFLLSFPQEQVSSLHRELRIARVEAGVLTEIPCQVHSEIRRGAERYCRIICLMDSQPNQTQSLLVLYGNPEAEFPEYPSDLTTSGEGTALDITNAHFRAALSRQTGQLERLTLFREHGMELYSGGEGHGEPPGIDWAHDYVDEGGFQKFRISLWDKCPDYEVIRGPLCTIVRRWGFPYSALRPLYTPARLHISVEYRFYAGLPWFHKSSSMKAVSSFRAEALRDEEWVFTGQSFTDILWMGSDGRLQSGEVPAAMQDDIRGAGFFNRDSHDSFMALYLEHDATGIPELKHNGAPILFYRWHGSLWSRYPMPVKDIPEGAVIRQKNAYLAMPFTQDSGAATIEQLRRCLLNPLTVAKGSLPAISEQSAVSSGVAEIGHPAEISPGLARAGERPQPGHASQNNVSKETVWKALRDCKDAQFYKSDVNIVELGLVRDIRIRGDVVTVLMTVPHPGRPRLNYFVHGSISVHPALSVPVRERLLQIPGVRHVVIRHVAEPAWSFSDLTDDGRKKLELDDSRKN